MDVLEWIKGRRSIKAFRPDPVPREVVERLLDAAVWAPNHKMTEPWRFYVLGPESKRRFAELRRRLRAEKAPDPGAPEVRKALDRVYEDAVGTPVWIAVSCAVSEDKVRREEDFAATAMAVQNLLLAATGLGLGTYLRTGELIEHPEMKALLGLPADHRIFGVVSVGHPAEIPTKKRTPYTEKTVWLP